MVQPKVWNAKVDYYAKKPVEYSIMVPTNQEDGERHYSFVFIDRDKDGILDKEEMPQQARICDEYGCYGEISLDNKDAQASISMFLDEIKKQIGEADIKGQMQKVAARFAAGVDSSNIDEPYYIVRVGQQCSGDAIRKHFGDRFLPALELYNFRIGNIEIETLSSLTHLEGMSFYAGEMRIEVHGYNSVAESIYGNCKEIRTFRNRAAPLPQDRINEFFVRESESLRVFWK